ncbi:unnamed protein product, partial [Closterium sp. NIES-53]
QVAASCSCRLLSHKTLLWHHRLGHPSLPRLRGMHSRLPVSGLPRYLPPLPPSPAPPSLPCFEGRQRATPHSSSFPPTTAPLQTLHMDVWGPARINGQGRERYFLLVVDDYTRYTTVFPLRSKGEVSAVLIPWIRSVCLQLRARFGQDHPVLRLHSDRGERRIGLVMEVARTSMIHAAAPHFLWPFAVRVKRPPGSPPNFKARYVARGFSQRQGVDYFHTFSPTPKMTTLRVLLHVAAQHEYELHSLDFSTAFLQGSLHEEIWLRRPSGFTWSFPTAHPSLFLRTVTSAPPFYVLVYVLQRFGFQYSSPQPTPLSTSHSLSAPPSDKSVEPSGPYPELLGCLMYPMTCTRPDLAYPLSLLARYVAPGRHRKVQWDAAKRVLRYLCSTSGMGLVLGGRGLVVLTGHADASWVDDLATQRSSQGYTFSLGSGSVSWRSTRSSSVLSSSCEAEIYAGAMAAQELRWLTYLLTDLGEQPCSPPVLYIDNKAMIALCQEHRLEHRTKHIALRYFLAQELQQRGQLRLAYVATRANTADVFNKALPPGDHQRFVTVLGLLALLFLTCL